MGAGRHRALRVRCRGELSAGPVRKTQLAQPDSGRYGLTIWRADSGVKEECGTEVGRPSLLGVGGGGRGCLQLSRADSLRLTTGHRAQDAECAARRATLLRTRGHG